MRNQITVMKRGGAVARGLVWVLIGLAACAQALAQTRGIAITPDAPIAPTPYAQGIYRALVIGNDDYADPQRQWRPLATAVSDARAVARMLQQEYGFADVQVLENATRRDTLHALSDLARRLGPEDSVLLYYAGHGYMEADTRRGYWVPVDAQGTDRATLLYNSTIRDEIGVIATRARHTLLISDSCFSGTLLRDGLRGAVPVDDAEPYLRKVASKKSVQVITAGGAEYVDDDYQDSGHSPFTYFLLNELKHNDKPVLTASELSGNVGKAVANNVDQMPASGTLQGAGDEMGEFIFVKVRVKVDAPGVDASKIKVKVEVEPGETAEAPAPPKPKESARPRSYAPLPSL